MNNKEYICRIAVIGDSISEGLGKKKYNYCNELKENIEKELKINCKVKNFAFTGKTIFYANEIRKEIELFKPNIIISFFGSVDGMVRPNKKKPFWSLLPKRYTGNGMLDPRPFYSRNKIKSFCEHIDSFIRWHIKILLMKLCGTYSWVSIEEFEKEYRKFLDYFNGKSNLILVSTVYVDEKYFPNTNDNYILYNECIEKLSHEYKQEFIDVYSLQKKKKWNDIYGDDHFHPNLDGYTWYAKVLSDKILNKKELIYGGN
ncbi:GDSL-type esterase/lipase family protein [Clostridium perfringens]|nr:GDSL-type esterase/lipase family protein [Clostridium perfringens]